MAKGRSRLLTSKTNKQIACDRNLAGPKIIVRTEEVLIVGTENRKPGNLQREADILGRP